jgi:hypothetical protein
MIGPRISRWLARKDFAKLGLTEREIEFAVRRNLLSEHRLYEHVVREFYLKKTEYVETLDSICVNYHELVHKLSNALPLNDMRELDYEIHNSLAHVRETGVYTER